MDTIEEIIKQTEVAFNTGDAEALANTFTDDGWSVSVNGHLLQGRDEIFETSRQLFAGPLQGQFARYVVDDVQHVAPGIAIVRKLAYTTDEGGNDTDAHPAMIALYVLVRHDDGWRVAARQNTLVQR